MKLKKLPSALITISAAALLTACVDGVDLGTGTTGTTYNLTGTVPGTLIEAFCMNGGYYKTNSINDGSAQHPFSLSLPSGVNCTVVMTTNETNPATRVITSIEIEYGAQQSSLFSLSSNTDLGYVPLEMDRTLIDDANNDGIKDTPLLVTYTLNSGPTITTAASALDSDDDGIPNAYEDDDGDGEHNFEDLDDDNDGTLDKDEISNDIDHDGITNDNDIDDDNDGLSDDDDSDDDNDGISDDDDLDDDNDGVDDSDEDDDD